MCFKQHEKQSLLVLPASQMNTSPVSLLREAPFEIWKLIKVKRWEVMSHRTALNGHHLNANKNLSCLLEFPFVS